MAACGEEQDVIGEAEEWLEAFLSEVECEGCAIADLFLVLYTRVIQNVGLDQARVWLRDSTVSLLQNVTGSVTVH
ncbi:hypothetical protein ACUN0C_19130 [Faunimonas sp. B44]|uniref:hypothetical protein n=1 Tax=Faunimonas sp. B44 TaxID=3461493 RepID=UPI004043EA4E